MATVTGMTAEAIDALLGTNIVSASVDENGQLILQRRSGELINAGVIADVDSPNFTGSPTAPTPATSDNSQKLATTAFVKDQAYAPLASPILTGDPKAPTPAVGDNDTSIATTAFVKAQNYATTAQSNLDYKRSGTTAERDATFGVPSTSAQRLALATLQPIWFNTDLGWTESYYEVDTLSGPSVPGLRTGLTAGWYPVGHGPFANVTGNAKNTGPDVTYDQIEAFGTGGSIRRGGSTYFTTTSSELTIKKPGFYDIRTVMYIPNGSGVHLDQMRVFSSVGAVIHDVSLATPMYEVYGQLKEWSLYKTYIPANARVAFRTQIGGGTIDLWSMTAEYVAPPLIFN